VGYLRFYKRKRIGPGSTLNFGKRGISSSIGPRGFKLTGGRSTRVTLGIPGTGLYYTTKVGGRSPSHKKRAGRARKAVPSTTSRGLSVVWLVGALLVIALWGLIIGLIVGGALLWLLWSLVRSLRANHRLTKDRRERTPYDPFLPATYYVDMPIENESDTDDTYRTRLHEWFDAVPTEADAFIANARWEYLCDLNGISPQ
jgi:uncharacterized integral membrane protein